LEGEKKATIPMPTAGGKELSLFPDGGRKENLSTRLPSFVTIDSLHPDKRAEKKRIVLLLPRQAGNSPVVEAGEHLPFQRKKNPGSSLLRRGSRGRLKSEEGGTFYESRGREKRISSIPKHDWEKTSYSF